MKNTINFATKAQAAMFKHEFLGQFSDGAWENSPGERWKGWSDVKVSVNDQNVGRNFESHYHNFDRYNLARKDLLEVVEERLLGIARVAQRWGVKAAGMLEGILFDCNGWTGLPKHTGKYWDEKRSDIALWMQDEGINLDDVRKTVETTTYGPKQLRKDLKEMKLMMRMRCREEAPAPKPVADKPVDEEYADKKAPYDSELNEQIREAFAAGQHYGEKLAEARSR